MENQRRILCIGEILWDALPTGLYLGGAPLNVCYHLNQLGIKADISSKVGNDRLGKEALHRIKYKGISTENIQLDHEVETGFVRVEIKENGDPTYDIIQPAAWDFIEVTPELEELVKGSWGLVFGSLAQRHPTSRETIRKLWEYNVQKILDLNLRLPYVEEEIVRDSLNVADIVKMNKQELNQIKEWYTLSTDDHKAVEELAVKFNCSLVCITKGAGGAMVYKEESWYEHHGYSVQSKTKDGVGAGDAFLAAMIYGIQKRKTGRELLAYANAAGSLVAQKSGATPDYNVDDLKKIINC